MATLSDEKNETSQVLETPKRSSSVSSPESPGSPDSPVNANVNVNVDAEKNASTGGTYLVTQLDGSSTSGLKVAKDGVTVLIPQPSEDPQDPLNWSWKRKHLALGAILLPSLLTDWGMTWGTTLFEAQAAEWGMSVVDVSASVSGGIFLQGPGGVLAVPFIQRYGRLPVLFWSQVLGTITVLIATFMPSYAGFTAFRTLQGFFATAPQVVGLSVVHDLFFFHERTRKLNIWAFMFLVGPYLGPFISSFLLSVVSWRVNMGILAASYAVSTILVVLLGEETLYDREKSVNPTEGASHLSLLIGTAGFKAKGQTSLAVVSKHLAEISIKPQLLLPCLYIMFLFAWAIGIVTSVTQFVRPPPYLLNNTNASLLYLAPIAGGIIGEIWGHWFNDFLCNRYIKKHNGQYQPENRLWGVWPSCVFGICGMVLYGQTLYHTLPIVALAFAWGMMVFACVSGTVAISAYVLDTFPHHAALTSSWINFWRTTGGFAVPYFQFKWVARSGTAVTFGSQGAIIFAGFFFVIATQFFGKTWRARHSAPVAEK